MYWWVYGNTGMMEMDSVTGTGGDTAIPRMYGEIEN